jgi:signal transduction histidine kinase
VPSEADRRESTLRPRARLVHTIGSELISSDRVALTELVKNGYDADAGNVLVRFEAPLTKGGGALWVIDDGEGMSEDVIRNAWLEPAHSHRRRNELSSRLSRVVLGEKGIGRFAAARLSDTFELFSRRGQTEVSLRLRWADFADESKYLDEVRIRWDVGAPKVVTPGGLAGKIWARAGLGTLSRHGTALRMSGLRAEWSSQAVSDLRTELSRLIAPKPAGTKDEPFQIHLDVPDELKEFRGLIEVPAALRRPRYLLTAKVDADGLATLTFKINRQDPKSLAKNLAVQLRQAPRCGPFTFEMRVWDRDRDAMSELADRLSTSSADIRRALDESAGVSVYRDGFRVFPYGERGNDWLGLDRRRIQNPTLRLSNNQVIGFVHITRKANPALQDQTNREGLMEGHALDDLRHLILSAITTVEGERFRVRPREPKSGGAGLFDDLQLDEIQAHIRKRHANDKALAELIDQTQDRIRHGVDRVREVLSRYRRLASLGALIDLVVHEGRQPVTAIVNEADLGTRDLSRDMVKPERLKSRFALIADQANLLATVFRKIEPLGGRRRGRPVEVLVEDIIRDAFAVVMAEAQQSKIKIDLPKTKTPITADPAEIQEVMLNLAMNSLYWLREVPAERRRIQVRVERPKTGELRIVFSDSGPGVPSDVRDRIFEPYFSARPDGFGLGLTLAGEIVSDYYDGTLELVEPSMLGGATFHVTLKKRV